MTAKRISRWLVLGFVIAGLTAGPVTLAGASSSVTLDGSFFSVRAKPQVVNAFCPSGVADQCGTIELVGLGAADWTYDFGPTFEPDGSCFDVDGTFTMTLQSDGSTISGPLTGLFCPSASSRGQQQGGPPRTATPSWRTTSSCSPTGLASSAGSPARRVSTRFPPARPSEGRFREPSAADVFGGGGGTAAPATSAAGSRKGRRRAQTATVMVALPRNRDTLFSALGSRRGQNARDFHIKPLASGFRHRLRRWPRRRSSSRSSETSCAPTCTSSSSGSPASSSPRGRRSQRQTERRRPGRGRGHEALLGLR